MMITYFLFHARKLINKHRNTIRQ